MMDLGTPQDWAQSAGAIKSAFDALTSAWKLIKDFSSSGKASPAEAALVDRALDEAASASKVAEAQVAKALGYQLCHCAFPPTAMLTVGATLGRRREPVTQVYECPKCGFVNCAYDYKRTAPPRQTPVIKGAP